MALNDCLKKFYKNIKGKAIYSLEFYHSYDNIITENNEKRLEVYARISTEGDGSNKEPQELMGLCAIPAKFEQHCFDGSLELEKKLKDFKLIESISGNTISMA